MARYAQLKLEDSPGNESVTPTYLLPATAWYLPAEEVLLNPNHAPLNRNDEQRGVDARLPVAQNEYAPTGQIVMRHYPNYIGAILMLLFGDVATTTGNGIITDPDMATIPTGAWKHVFVKAAGPAPKTATITNAYGSSWLRARGVTAESMAFALAADGIKATAALLANYMARLTSDPGLVPSYDPFSILPFRRRNVTLTWGEGTANIESIAFTLAQHLEPVRDMGIATGFPTDTERVNAPDGFLGLTGSMTRRDFDNADFDALLNSGQFNVKIKMTSEQNIGATTYPYSMWVECPAAQFMAGTLEALKNQPRHEISLDWHAAYSFVDSFDFRVTLINSTPAYK